MRDAPPADMPTLILLVEMMVREGMATKRWDADRECWAYEIVEPTLVSELNVIREEQERERSAEPV